MHLENACPARTKRYIVYRYTRRGAGVADRAALEMPCALWVPWVRIPPSPLLPGDSGSQIPENTGLVEEYLSSCRGPPPVARQSFAWAWPAANLTPVPLPPLSERTSSAIVAIQINRFFRRNTVLAIMGRIAGSGSRESWNARKARGRLRPIRFEVTRRLSSDENITRPGSVLAAFQCNVEPQKADAPDGGDGKET